MEQTNMDITLLDCCGVAEMSGISYVGGPEAALRILVKGEEDLLDQDALPPFFIFTDGTREVTRDTPGQRLRRYIEQHKLGSVQFTTAKCNPRTDNMIRVFVWSPNVRNLERWARKRKLTPFWS